MRLRPAAVVLLTLVVSSHRTSAAEADLAERIRSAAVEIALIQKSEGNDGALLAVAKCYESAVAETASLEDAQKCATQDWVISQTSIAFFSLLGPVGKQDPSYKVALEAGDRIAALLWYKKGLTGAESAEFYRLLKLHALPAFEKARL
jgi:hypothetical protein